MNEGYLDYKADLEVDRDNLDLEWARQPGVYAKWAERLVDTENKRDRKKNLLELTYAELDSDIRAAPGAYGLEDNPTERSIKSVILKSKKYKALQEEFLQLKKDASILRIAVRSFRDREKVIDRLTKLYLSKYYAEGSQGVITKDDVPFYSDPESQPTIQAQAALNASMRTKKLLGR